MQTISLWQTTTRIPIRIIFSCLLLLAVIAFLIPSSAQAQEENTYEPNVEIPGVTLIQPESSENNSLLAQYIEGAQRYLISISSIAATIMFIWGAFLYLLGSSVGKVQTGKTIMLDAVIGMLLVLGATAILRILNPNLVTLPTLNVAKVETQTYMTSLIGNDQAAAFLSQLGLPPTGTGGATNLKIPRNIECPGRDRSYQADGVASIAGQTLQKSNYTISWRGQTITNELIDAYEREQALTGIPAAVIIAQIFNESGGSCPVINLFGNPGVCGGLHSQYYNFGGIGCTQKQVPDGVCAHIAFPNGARVGSTAGAPYSITKEKVNDLWNKHISPNCVNALDQGATRDTYTNCGSDCYPQKSHASIRVDGKEIWLESVQCSRKFSSAEEFLASHLGFVRACLPYNDSVYKFAYCIGASTYAGQTGAKGLVLAEIIERNCLCDPATDSLGCVRDKQLEQDLVSGLVKKTNLYTLYSQGQPQYDQIVQQLWEKTGGRLTPGPSDDIKAEVNEEGEIR